LVDVWADLDEGAARLAGQGRACEPWGTWFPDWGVRGLACTAAQVRAPGTLVALAPAAPFRSGPHVATAESVALDLRADRAFGRYDPLFVRWIGDAAIPAG
jgi:hypothetical protein